MKNYIAFAIGLSFISATYAADPAQFIPATVRYYKTYDDAVNGRVSGTVKIFIGPDTTIFDIQDTLRKTLGKGHLRFDSDVVPGEPIKGERQDPFLNLFGPQEVVDALENNFSFWAFDVEDAK
jgi:hypothetical protein